MQRKTWYSILGVDAKPLSFKLVTYNEWGNLAYVKAVRLLRVALAPLLCCFSNRLLPMCSLTLSSILTANYSPKLTPCIQSHCKEVTQGAIFGCISAAQREPALYCKIGSIFPFDCEITFFQFVQLKQFDKFK